MQRCTRMVLIIAGLMLMALAAARPAVAQPQHKDYLSDEEADKIRDADTPSLRIKLYLTFAEDRLKKFEYEISRTVPERHRSDILSGLLNGYAGCMDDAADQIDVARDKQMNIRDALKLMQTKGKEFLDLLEKYDKSGPDLDSYRDPLEDAIDGTKDALSDASEAEKEMLPPPVRRKP
jgi:hypothetical protein